MFFIVHVSITKWHPGYRVFAGFERDSRKSLLFEVVYWKTETERSDCAVYLANFFQMAGLLIEEINRMIYSHDLVINQKHFVDPAVQELSHIFSIYLRSSPPLSVVIMFNCNQSTGFGIIDLRHSENSSLLTSFKWKFAIFYPAVSLAIPNLFSFNSVQHILHFCPQLAPKRGDWKLVNFFFCSFLVDCYYFIESPLYDDFFYYAFPSFSCFNCFLLYTSLVCPFLLWTVSVHRVFLLN